MLRCHDHMHACLWRHAVENSYLSLLWSTCHDPSSMPDYPSPFCEPATTHPSHWPTLLCLNWFTLAMCPWHRHMLSIGPIRWMWMCCTFGSQGMFWWWILIQPLVIYRTVLKKCHLSSGIGSLHVACLPVWWPIILRNSIARVICPSTYAQDPFSLPTDLPLLLSLSLCNLTHLSCQQVPVWASPIVWCENQWDTKFNNSIQPLRQKVSQDLCWAQHPIFFF